MNDHWDDDDIDDCVTASDPDLFPPTERIDVLDGIPRFEPSRPLPAERTMMRSFFDPTLPDSMPRWVAPTPPPVSPWAPHARAIKPVFPKPPLPTEPPPPESSSVPRIEPSSQTVPRRRVDLMWFDADSLPHVRAAIPSEESDDALYLKGLLSDAEGGEDAIARALESDARLLVLSGELRFPFDELARLRALVAGASPLITGDDELERIVGTAKELLDGAWVSACTAAQLADAIHTALRHRKRKSASLVALEEGVERVLLRERRYQRRTVFGGAALRTLFGRSRTPAYLPEAVADVLPMFHALHVTLLAEAHLSQDQYETSPHALRVLALGRS
jgi:hypothetical protein